MITVIGSGPAGISAAIYLRRANIPVMIITNHTSSLKKASLIENYYGSGTISGDDLYNRGLDSAVNLGIPIIGDEVLNISGNFIVEGIRDSYECDYIVLATGSSKKKANIKGAESFEGKGVSYCATCDGYFFKNKRLAIIGNGEYANHEYQYLKNIGSETTIYPTQDIKEIIGSDKVKQLLLTDGRVIDVDGVFVCDEYPDSSILAKKIGIIEDNGHIVVNDSMETNIQGVYACGDVTGNIKQIATAVYEGMLVANAIIELYKQKKD